MYVSDEKSYHKYYTDKNRFDDGNNLKQPRFNDIFSNKMNNIKRSNKNKEKSISTEYDYPKKSFTRSRSKLDNNRSSKRYIS